MARGLGAKETWNGLDWYVSFGEETRGRSWDDARIYGFICAGVGEWYSRSLKVFPIGAQIFPYIPKTGYVGVGTVTGTAQRLETAVVRVNGELQALADLSFQGAYQHPPLSEGEDADE